MVPSIESVLLLERPESLAIRWLHFLALAVALGGAAVLAVADEIPPALARRYEYAFWAALGIAVLTGVGNAGALAPAVPGPGTAWGRLFALKLLGVLALIAFSVARTGAVSRRRSDSIPDRRWYAATAAWITILVAVAVVMARG